PNAACDAGKYDYDNGSLDQIPAYCVVREWLHRERASRPALASLSALGYGQRGLNASPAGLVDFDTYAPGSDLRMVDASLQNGQVVLNNDRSIMSVCALDPQKSDVKRPMVSWDATRI